VHAIEPKAKAGGLAQEDKAAASFLKLLVILCDVFLQDSAILQLSKSSSPLDSTSTNYSMSTGYLELPL
jgi:hypothetical protein